MNLKLESQKHVPASRRFVELVKSQIRTRQLKPGDRLPPLRQLSKSTGVGNYSIAEAISVLRKEGLIEAAPRRGTFVAKDAATRLRHAQAATAKKSQRLSLAVLSAFVKAPEGLRLWHPHTVSGIFDECKKLNACCHLVMPQIALQSAQETVAELSQNGYDGAIWLYPQQERFDVIRAIEKAGIPIVVTSHIKLDGQFNTVEGDKTGVGRRCGEHLVARGCKKILYFCAVLSLRGEKAEVSSLSEGAGQISSERRDQQAMVQGLQSSGAEIELIQTPLTGGEYREIVRSALQEAEPHTGVILTDMQPFRDYLHDERAEVVALLKKCEVVLETDRSRVNELGPLAEEVEFYTSISMMNRVGQVAVHKLLNLIEGRFENTSTQINLEFCPFHQIHNNQE